MHPSISEFPNQLYYEGKLKDGANTTAGEGRDSEEGDVTSSSNLDTAAAAASSSSSTLAPAPRLAAIPQVSAAPCLGYAGKVYPRLLHHLKKLNLNMIGSAHSNSNDQKSGPGDAPSNSTSTNLSERRVIIVAHQFAEDKEGTSTLNRKEAELVARSY